jgi:hypothetical protein
MPNNEYALKLCESIGIDPNKVRSSVITIDGPYPPVVSIELARFNVDLMSTAEQIANHLSEIRINKKVRIIVEDE